MGSEVPDKNAVRDQLKSFILVQCDPDIVDAFAPHAYTLEPLLLQLVREIQRLQSGERRP